VLTRARFLAAFAASFVALLLAATAQAGSLGHAESRLLAAVNRVRTQRGLRPLRIDPRLERAARAHSADMLRTGDFAHGNVFARLQAFGARGPVLAENLAWESGYPGPSAVVGSWLASPIHRANLLRAGFARIGIGASTGRFGGFRHALVVTADFAGH
jgi:uncharacterized protein YkwD